MAKASACTDVEHRRVARDCVVSDDLLTVERGIAETIKGVVLCKKTLCISLARIKTLELYKQIGISSFSQYLKAKRINIHYHTAHDYARIGEIYMKHRESLKRIEFGEENGLRKLLLLENALERAEGQSEAVFEKLKESSYREFKNYLAGDCRSGRPDSAEDQKKLASFLTIEISDECVLLEPSGRELIWFDTELEGCFESEAIAQQFKHCILKAIREFFIKKKPGMVFRKPRSMAAIGTLRHEHASAAIMQ